MSHAPYSPHKPRPEVSGQVPAAACASDPVADASHHEAASSKVDVTVVVPCFNEADGIEQLHHHLMGLLEEARDGVSWEFLLVDDGSSDGTAEKIESTFQSVPNLTLIRHPHNQGLIHALQSGFDQAQGRWVACLDADCTYSPLLVNQLLAEAEGGFDVVTASPYHRDGRVENVAAWRIALSRLASRMYSWVMQSQLSCYTCCVRIYDRRLLQGCRLTFSGFVGVTELLWRLEQSGARMSEVPAVLQPRVTGVSKMRTLRTTMQHLRLLATVIRERVFKTRSAKPNVASDGANRNATLDSQD